MTTRFLHLALATALLGTACNGGDSGDAGPDGSADGSTDGHGGMDALCKDDDADGHGDHACGGDDCDDADPNRYPGNTEVCDSAGHDEDCDALTLGPDGDGDGAPYIGCCDVQSTGTLLCGDDCDDTRRTVGPTAVEVCNGIDDDCDGHVDEGVSSTFCFDVDGDGYGDLATTMQGCRIPIGATTICNDCDDSDPGFHPGAFEPCDGTDHDCSGVVDDGCTCTDGTTHPCGSALGVCTMGTQACTGGVWSSVCDGATLPTVELCDGVDDDCDGMVDEGLTYRFVADCDGDGYGNDASAMDRCNAPTTPPAACARGVWTFTGGDCDDRDAARYPGHGCTTSDGGMPDAGPGVHDIVQLSLGESFTCARRAGGAVMCWGGNFTGMLGDGYHTTGLRLPAAVPGITDARFLVARSEHACVVHASGAVDCWGYDEALGSSTLAVGSPTPIMGAAGVTDATGGISHTCLRGAGGVQCFGLDLVGELGGGTAGTGIAFPPLFAVPAGTAGAVEIDSRGRATCVRNGGGTVSCWGDDSLGQLGDAGGIGASATPVGVSGVSGATAIAVGSDHACALHAGAVTCWGDDSLGQLGDGGAPGPHGAVAVSGLTDATSISAGDSHTCVVRGTGDVACWGAGTRGQLGDGTELDRHVPVSLGFTDGVEVACGSRHTCARHADGSVDCWGENAWGELGDGTMGSSATPVRAVFP